MIALHDSSNKSFREVIVDSVVVIMCRENVVVVVITPFLAVICNQRLPTIDHPLAIRSLILSRSIWPNSYANNHIAFAVPF